MLRHQNDPPQCKTLAAQLPNLNDLGARPNTPPSFEAHFVPPNAIVPGQPQGHQQRVCHWHGMMPGFAAGVQPVAVGREWRPTPMGPPLGDLAAARLPKAREGRAAASAELGCQIRIPRLASEPVDTRAVCCQLDQKKIDGCWAAGQARTLHQSACKHL